MSPTNKNLKISSSKALGQAIRQKRKAAGLTQANLAALCGVGTRFLSDLENGKPTAHIGKTLNVLNGIGLVLYLFERAKSEPKEHDSHSTTSANTSNIGISGYKNFLDEISASEQQFKASLINSQDKSNFRTFAKSTDKIASTINVIAENSGSNTLFHPNKLMEERNEYKTDLDQKSETSKPDD